MDALTFGDSLGRLGDLANVDQRAASVVRVHGNVVAHGGRVAEWKGIWDSR